MASLTPNENATTGDDDVKESRPRKRRRSIRNPDYLQSEGYVIDQTKHYDDGKCDDLDEGHREGHAVMVDAWATALFAGWRRVNETRRQIAVRYLEKSLHIRYNKECGVYVRHVRISDPVNASTALMLHGAAFAHPVTIFDPETIKLFRTDEKYFRSELVRVHGRMIETIAKALQCVHPDHRVRVGIGSPHDPPDCVLDRFLVTVFFNAGHTQFPVCMIPASHVNTQRDKPVWRYDLYKQIGYFQPGSFFAAFGSTTFNHQTWMDLFSSRCIVRTLYFDTLITTSGHECQYCA